ncbi:lysozyme g [Beggiatoa sp. PS]|nr:lysozyme g [Beggiatoa sp. PS]
MQRPGRRSSNFSWFKKLFGIEQPQSPDLEPSPQPTKPSHPGEGQTTLDINNPTMLKQLNEAKRYRAIIETASRQYGLQPSVICGMGSRESHWGLGLTPPAPNGRGDFARRRPRGDRRTPEPPDGPGYGRGLMQIDYDWHEFARTGRWYVPKENIIYACTVLDKAKTFFRNKRVRLSDQQMLQAMIAAYNGGATATLRAIQAGQDIDANTTGRDYSRDVLNRSGWFRLHGWR